MSEKIQDINEHQIPPGGWQYRVPQTKWAVPNPVSVTLDQATRLTIKHLLGNPAVVAKHKLATDYATVKHQIMDYTRKRLGIEVAVPSAASFHQPPSRRNAVAAVGAKIARLAAGFGVITDWLGDGGEPVAGAVAQSRAEVCVRCPKNERGDLTRWFTVPASNAIRKAIEARADLRLATTKDDDLHVCSVCLCPLKTKVHTPLAHVLKHLSAEVRAELPDNCWMVTGEGGAARRL